MSLKRIEYLTIGAAALSGTTHPIDRHLTQELLDLQICENSLDAVSDRDISLKHCIIFHSLWYIYHVLQKKSFLVD